MLIKVEDLKVGDEILVPFSNVGFKYMKVLRSPELRWKRDANGVKGVVYGGWGTALGKLLYKQIKSSLNCEVSYVPRRWPVGAPDRMQKKYICTSEGHNTEMSSDLNYKQIWLVRRE